MADPKYGPLPALLLTLTVVTGLVDAVSILALGRVFVANMTGNVVFIGFALAGAPGFSLSASLAALGGFLVGAFGAGLVIRRGESSRAKVVLQTVLLELVLVWLAAVVAQVSHFPYSNPVRDVVAGLAAIGMGIQNAMARRLAVPDLTTTVLTMTLTGIAVDVRERNTTALTRRTLAVGTMLGGAVLGATLVDDVRASVPLWIASALIAAVAFMTLFSDRNRAAWATS